ncbi:MAG: Rne/Rng family ribonuclease [Rikenellaceae bacterium]|jgi:ribonuclease G|nr:Rne/Rng family ribonuclease [Rikenellaceae bacterium]
MNKELIINVTPREVEIALVEDKELVEFSKEQCQTGFAVGDIYLGRVRKLMPGLNAAFVNIGHERDAFIHYLDLGVQFDTLQKYVKGLVAKKQRMPRFENLKFAPALGKNGKIGEHIAVGDPVLVQIAKEAISTKGPRLTSDISLAGRHVVLLPLSNKISISQKICQNSERKRLKRIVDKVLPKNYGVIIRTAAVGTTDQDIEQDILALIAKWEAALVKLKGQTPPLLLSEEMNRANSMIRDQLNGDFKAIHVSDKAMYDDLKEYIKMIAPEKSRIMKLYKGNLPIFDNFDITRQIKSLFSKYVSLKRGAYLIIEHTEALHVIDVNSGNRTKAENDQEHTAMDVNLAAAAEIARQLRLRDMGGIIVVDFIDLHKSDNRQALLDKMTQLMSTDRAKHTILPLSKFGLMQITRQRVRPEAIAEATEVCPCCNGTGVVAPTLGIDQQIENQVSYFTQKKNIKNLVIKSSPFVAAFLTRGFPSPRVRWMWKYRAWIDVHTDQALGVMETQIVDKKNRKLV